MTRGRRFAGVCLVAVLHLECASSALARWQPPRDGLYAVHNDELVEVSLDGLPCCPVNPRPPPLAFPNGNVSFLISAENLSEDLRALKPLYESAQVELIGNVRRQVSVDKETGQFVSRDTDHWDLVGQIYRLSASAVRGKRNSVWLRYSEPGFELPPGRYALRLNVLAVGAEFRVAGKQLEEDTCWVANLSDGTYRRCSTDERTALVGRTVVPSPHAWLGTKPEGGFCNLVSRSEIEALLSRRIVWTRYEELRPGDRWCVLSVQIAPSESAASALEISFRSARFVSSEAAIGGFSWRAAVCRPPADSVEYWNAPGTDTRACVRYSEPAGRLEVGLVQDRRHIQFSAVLLDDKRSIVGFAKPSEQLEQQLTDYGNLLFARWKLQ